MDGTPNSFFTWPFLPFHQWTAEQQALWWQEVFLSNPAFELLCERPNWRILGGGIGSGKSILLRAFAHSRESRDLVLEYPEVRWPCSKEALVAGGGHLSQVMALAARALREETLRSPEKLATLSPSTCDFMRWLIERFLGERMWITWLDKLGRAEGAAVMRNVPSQSLYQSDSESSQVQAQVEELINLCQDLGFKEILVLMDVPLLLSEKEMSSLQELFGWLGLMQFPGLAVVAAIPTPILQRTHLVERTRSRASLVELKWSAEEARHAGERVLALATRGELRRLEDLASPDLLAQLQETLGGEYGEPSPQGWVRMVQILLEKRDTGGGLLGIDMKDALLRGLFERYMHLALDPNEAQYGVWRGPRFIPLDEKRFRFLAVFFENQGLRVDWLNQKLVKVAGSKTNMHQLVSRLRKDIDPFARDEPGKPGQGEQEIRTGGKKPEGGGESLYLLNTRSEGYWLEHFDVPDTSRVN